MGTVHWGVFISNEDSMAFSGLGTIEEPLCSDIRIIVVSLDDLAHFKAFASHY